MQVSPRLRYKLRAFHFRRLEACIRLELADLLDLPPDAIEFVDWAQHDALLERRRSIYDAAQAGRVPLLERQWEYEEGERLNESLQRLARLAGRIPHSWTAYTIVGIGDIATQWVAQL